MLHESRVKLPLGTTIPRLCGQTATESPHDRQDYGGTAAAAEAASGRKPRGCRWVTPGDESGNTEVLRHPPVAQGSSFRRVNHAAGGRKHRVAGRHVPLAGWR